MYVLQWSEDDSDGYLRKTTETDHRVPDVRDAKKFPTRLDAEEAVRNAVCNTWTIQEYSAEYQRIAKAKRKDMPQRMGTLYDILFVNDEPPMPDQFQFLLGEVLEEMIEQREKNKEMFRAFASTHVAMPEFPKDIRT